MDKLKKSSKNLFFLVMLLFLTKLDASILVSEREIEIESEKAWEQMKTSLPISRDLSKRTQVTCIAKKIICLLYTSPSPRDAHESRMPSSA